MQNNKEMLRLWLKSKRMAMENSFVDDASTRINQNLVNLLNWESFKQVHCYETIESLKEPNTQNFIKFLEDKGIACDIPDKLQKVPKTDVRYDLIIVPTLGFDLLGNRIGWGGGFYDRLLVTQPKALKIGLCYESNLVRKGIPAEVHDIPLNIVVTEEKVRRFDR